MRLSYFAVLCLIVGAALVASHRLPPDHVRPAQDYHSHGRPANGHHSHGHSHHRPHGRPHHRPGQKPASDSACQRLVLISFDGFRYDYLNKTDTPNFDQMKAAGTYPTWMEARFITKTFPNHHSIATGVYEETHGIVSNQFYDPTLNAVFNLGLTGSEWWDTNPGVIPLYTLNQLSGGKSGGMMYPGTNAWIKDQTCDVFTPYDNTLSWFTRVDTMVSWLTDPTDPANLVFAYFEEPDSSGHTYGPDSPQVVQQIQRADNITGYLKSRLRDVGLENGTCLIVTSDHGFSSVPAANVIIMSDFIDVSQFDMYGSSPVYSIKAKDSANTDAIYQQFSQASLTRPFKAYKKADIPDVYHYEYNDRILDILVVANDHWDLVASSYDPGNNVTGNHGYNNSYEDMHPFFIAQGPPFKVGHKTANFRNIDIYPLVCCIMQLQAAPNNGSFANVADLLSDSELVNACSFQKNMQNRRIDK